jgi:hypothetical protein
MSAIAIHAWLKGPRNYAEGIALLKSTGEADETDLWFLELGETSLSREQLVNALSELHAREVRTAQLTPESAGKVHVTKAERVDAASPRERDVTTDGYAGLITRMPDHVKALHEQVKEWAREMHFLRHPPRMEALNSDEERLRDGLRVIELDACIVQAYARLDAWRDTGRDPGEAAPATSKNGAQLMQELKNIQSYLSRHRKGKRLASPAKVAQWEKQEKDIKALIDALPD